MFDRLIQDLRFALRQLLRHPGFSALLVLTIAVAIGANVAIFSVLEGIVLRPMSYQQPERLLAVWETPPDERWYQPFSAPDYFDVREQTKPCRSSESSTSNGSTFPAATNLYEFPGVNVLPAS